MELYESVLRPADAEAAREATMEILRSPREFAPPVGLIYTRAAEIERWLHQQDVLREYAERQKRLRIEYPSMKENPLVGGWFNPGHRLFLLDTEEGKRNAVALLEKLGEGKGN